jgi:hypothetical protein
MAISCFVLNKIKSLCYNETAKTSKVKCFSKTSQPELRLPAKVQYAYMAVAALCILMGSASIVTCALSVQLLSSRRGENDDLNLFIRQNSQSALFMNKCMYIKDAGLGTLSSSLAPILGYWKTLSVHALDYGPAFALAALTIHLFTND